MEKAALAKKIKGLQIVSAKLVESLFAGNYRSVFKGPGLEFAEVREYVSGDDVRFIDWNVTSRMGSPYTKTFREEREMILQLIVDMSPSLTASSGEVSKRETATTLLALMAFAAVANNDRVGTALFSDRIEHWVPPMKGKKHVLRMIDDVLTFKPAGEGSDLALALRTTQEAMKRRGICVILSDFRTTGYWRELSILSRKHDVIAIRLTDPLDREYPKTGLIELQDPETRETILGTGHSKKFRQEYHDFWELERLTWRRECRRRGVATLEVSTAEDPVTKLMRFFEGRR